MRIFVSVCSYQDPLLPHTIKSMMQGKSNRNDVVYSIFEQTRYEDSLACTEPVLVSRDDVIYKRIDPEYSDGAVWARYINLLNVTDDFDFIYQIDSHILHDHNWDRSLLEDYKRARDMCESNKVIITGSCKTFTILEEDDEIKTILVDPNVPSTSHVKYHTIDPLTLVPNAHGEKVPATDMPRPAFHIMAGNFFTHKDWVDNVGLDPKVFFEGEEVLMTMMSYAAGYNMYHHTAVPSYHLEDTKNWHTKKPVENTAGAKRRARLAETGIWRWRQYLDTCREDMLDAFKKEFGVDFIDLIIEERAKTYDLEINQQIPDPLAVARAAEQKKKNKKLPKPLFMKEEE